MPANTSPIFTLVPNVGTTAVTAANTNAAGTGTVATDIFKAFTAGANGSFVTRARFSLVATVASTASTATVARLFYSTITSGATTGGTNTWLLFELALPTFTADSPTAPLTPIEVMLNFAMPTGSFLHITNHAAPAANTSWHCVVLGGDY